MIGNFIGDFVKGSRYLDFRPEISRGIILHREIDSFTDTHPIVRNVKKKLHPWFNHYSGVALDMYFDHILAHSWKEFHPEDLVRFTEKNYRILQENFQLLPEKVKAFLPHMISNNWLVNYSRPEGIQKALNGISRRTTFESNLEKGAEVLLNHKTFFENSFNRFFPELNEHCKNFIAKGQSENK
jgi:acyl carrier protein phosphodiesterase